jgi:DNA-binding LytR/AlgR family response regulator
MKAIIIEDEIPAQKQLENYCSQNINIELIGTYRDVNEALRNNGFEKVDLIFLDVIAQETENNISSLKEICQNKLVIITTGHKEHAYESFRLNTVELLEKPIEQKDFDMSVHKACQIHKQNKLRNWFIKDYVIPYENIAYIATETSDIIRNRENIKKPDPRKKHIVLKEKINDRDSVIISGNDLSLDKILEQLPDDLFIKLNKNIIVAINNIFKKESQDLIVLKTGEEISVGGNYITKVKQYFRM